MNALTLNKSRKTWIWIAAALLVAIVVGWQSQRGGKSQGETVETDAVTRGDLRETVSTTGSLQALQTVQVGAQVSGTIDKIYADFNSRVKRGQLLALIDPSVLDMQMASARAALAQANARADDAAAALTEGMELLAKAYISEKDLRTLKVNAATTRAQLDSAKADFARATRNRQYAEIRSPIDGIVVERAVDRGQTVASGFQTPTLFIIAEDLKRMQILANVDESQIGAVRVGLPATFTVSAFPAKKFNAAVDQIRLKSTVVQNVVTYSVVLDADNSSGDLLPGMTATVEFVLKDLTDVMRVASSALRVQEQKVPRHLIDDATLAQIKKREGEHAEAPGGPARAPPGFAGQTGASPGRPPGGGNITPEQRQAFRERMANMQNGGGVLGAVWVLRADGKYQRVPVRVLGSDLAMTAIEPLRDANALGAGDKVITRIVAAAAQSGQARSIMPNQPGPPGRFR